MGQTKYFISYARVDVEFVQKMAQELRRAGVSLWLDELDILGGQRWDVAIGEALDTCQGMIVVISPDSVGSNNVMDEVSSALEARKLVVPVLYRECSIPFRLRRVQHIDFTADYDTGVNRLLQALNMGQNDASFSSRRAGGDESVGRAYPGRSQGPNTGADAQSAMGFEDDHAHKAGDERGTERDRGTPKSGEAPPSDENDDTDSSGGGAEAIRRFLVTRYHEFPRVAMGSVTGLIVLVAAVGIIVWTRGAKRQVYDPSRPDAPVVVAADNAVAEVRQVEAGPGGGIGAHVKWRLTVAQRARLTDVVMCFRDDRAEECKGGNVVTPIPDENKGPLEGETTVQVKEEWFHQRSVCQGEFCYVQAWLGDAQDGKTILNSSKLIKVRTEKKPTGSGGR